MTTSEEIINKILERIKYVSGDEIILENQFELQLAEIKKNFTEAIKEIKEAEKHNYILRLLKETATKDQGEFIEANKTFSQYYTRTLSSLESRLWLSDKYSPLNMHFILQEDVIIRDRYINNYRRILDCLNNIQIGLLAEDLSKIEYSFVNIKYNGSISNSEKSIPSLMENKNEYGIFRYRIQFIIYLISSLRIIKLEEHHGRISTEEHIIKKDLKKVSNTGANLYFHYHGLHDPDLLVLDTYEEAVQLRKQVSALRESKLI